MSRTSVAAEEFPGFGPITVINQHPLYLQNLSSTPMRALVLKRGVTEGRWDAAYSNLFERGARNTHLLDLDMELLRLAFHARAGLGRGFEGGIEIPFFHFDEGFLDGFVDGYHRAFGFPRGGREQVAGDRFSYRVAMNGVDRFNGNPESFRVDDVVLHLKHEVFGEETFLPAAWYADLKLPTGDRGEGVGSGRPDIGFGVALEKSRGRFHGYFNSGFVAVGGNDRFEPFQYGTMFTYMLAGEVTIFDNWSGIVQLDGSSPLFTRSTIDPWEGVPLDLVIGFKGEERELFWKNDLVWQAGFAEDVTGLGPSVDFTVFASLGLRFALDQQR